MVDFVFGVAVCANRSLFLNKPLLLWVRNPLSRVGGSGTCARVGGVLLPKIPLRSLQLEKQLAP
jgi:hypothetical protein